MGSGKVAKLIKGRDNVTRTYWVNPDFAVNSGSSQNLKTVPALSASHDNPYAGLDEIVEVEDVNGEMVGITPGDIRGVGVKYVYRNGQCMAMAAAISRNTGWPVVTREIELNLGGEKQRLLQHAYTLSPDGYLVDVDGALDWEGDRVKNWRGEDIVNVIEADQVDDLMDSYSHRLSEQNVDLAETFLDSVMEQYEEDRSLT